MLMSNNYYDDQPIHYPFISRHCKGCIYMCFQDRKCWCMKHIKLCENVATCTPRYK